VDNPPKDTNTMIYTHDRLIPISAERLAQNMRENDEARKVFDADMAAKEKAKTDAFNARMEIQFKADARKKYATLSDADFERLWTVRIKDEELLLQAAAVANRPLESWYQKF
jgi:hypothetical protein